MQVFYTFLSKHNTIFCKYVSNIFPSKEPIKISGLCKGEHQALGDFVFSGAFYFRLRPCGHDLVRVC